MGAIGKLTQNTPLRPPHARGGVRSATGLRRVSVRVVNFACSTLEDEDHVHLGGDDSGERVAEGDDERGEKVDEPLPDSSSVLPLHGRVLGFFGPTNHVRLAMYDFLIFSCVTFFFFFSTWR
ncbi:hypothetical protein BJY52DRAFT_1257998, partial [Lactarius psammicola]